MCKNEIPVWEKPYLTLEEAADYFNIGPIKVRNLTNEHQDLIFWNGTKRLIRRDEMRKFLDTVKSI